MTPTMLSQRLAGLIRTLKQTAPDSRDRGREPRKAASWGCGDRSRTRMAIPAREE